MLYGAMMWKLLVTLPHVPKPHCILCQHPRSFAIAPPGLHTATEAAAYCRIGSIAVFTTRQKRSGMPNSINKSMQPCDLSRGTFQPSPFSHEPSAQHSLAKWLQNCLTPCPSSSMGRSLRPKRPSQLPRLLRTSTSGSPHLLPWKTLKMPSQQRRLRSLPGQS